MAGDDSRVSGVAVGSIAAGALFLFAGIKGYSVPQTLQDVVTGKSPLTQVQAHPIGTPAAAPSSGSSPSGALGASAIGSNALAVVRHAYSYGGAPGPDGTGPWDCSSCADWVVGKMSGLPIPGGSWAAATANGSQHGPNTISWLETSVCETVGHTAAVAQSGDLCVWQTHMGIALGGGQMVSALNPQLGTRQTSIAEGAPAGEFLFVRRMIIGASNG